MSMAIGNLLALASAAIAGLVNPSVNPLVNKSAKVAPAGLDVLTVGIIGDYGWTGWRPAPESFCLDAMPQLVAANVTIPNEIIEDCGSDRASAVNATFLQEDTAAYVGQICAMKNCSAFISVGDNFYDTGIDFNTAGLIRFVEAWSAMYQQGIYQNAPWYQCLGNHDVLPGQPGVDMQTKVAPLMDSRWYFGTEQLPYYTYDLTGKDWTATFVVLDSNCFLDSYQTNTSVYFTPYLAECHEPQNLQVQIDFLEDSFAKSKADWKFLQLHHPYMSSATNETDLAPLISIVEKYNGVVLNGHDHCLAHYYNNNTNFVLSGAAGLPAASDCNYGVPLGPYAEYLAANSEAAASGFVTMDISAEFLNFEYYVRNMQYDGGDLYPVANDMVPSYSFKVTKKAI
ncbi:hypothetical protein CDV55_100669 [Aspergillus turcosus]|uniref:Calcineurin-like phosphoesterase domain-containing protein n=1 Tax=Aspergillus turcosus TaxID=1245748 RepID=A0A229YM50_9EURO|nr:hypothetical protein CDV55_100669 [Aspergillus turcosus]RLL94749.1 hypothetical protein CFD26_104790 [Aspergillus turcosus]